MVIPESGRALFTPAIEGFYVFYESAAGTRLALQLFLVKRFKLYSFQLQAA